MSRVEKAVLFSLAGVLCVLLILLAVTRSGLTGKLRGEYGVYFLAAGDEGLLIRAPRSGLGGQTTEEKVAAAVRSLLSGLTEAETGCFTSIPDGVRLRDCRVSDGIAYLDFSREIEEGGGTLMMRTRLAQIVFTATQFPGVRKVRFLIEGREIPYFSGEGLSEVENPLGREDFTDFHTGARR